MSRNQSSAVSVNEVSRNFLSLLVVLMPKCGLCVVAYLNLFNIVGVSFAGFYSWILPLMIGLLIVNLVIGFMKAKRLNNYIAFLFSLVGVAVILMSKVVVKEILLTWMGVIVLCIGTVTQLIQSRKVCNLN